MAGFVDVVLRGLILVLTSVALGGVAWLRFVLRAEAHVKPDAPTALALRAIAVAALGAAVAQAAIVLVGLGALADAHGAWPVGAFLDTTVALTAVGRVVLAGPVAPATTIRRFSTLAFWSMAAIVLAGVALSVAYVGDPAALVGTAYGVMVVSKVALLVPALALAYVNIRAARRAAAAPGARLFGFVEVELG